MDKEIINTKNILIDGQSFANRDYYSGAYLGCEFTLCVNYDSSTNSTSYDVTWIDEKPFQYDVLNIETLNIAIVRKFETNGY